MFCCPHTANVPQQTRWIPCRPHLPKAPRREVEALTKVALKVAIVHTMPHPVGLLPAGPTNFWSPLRGMYVLESSGMFCVENRAVEYLGNTGADDNV
jgi:hypothetical protein